MDKKNIFPIGVGEESSIISPFEKEIYLTYGIGEGPTMLSAFDTALLEAGVANFNHMRYSSVIPSGSEIVDRKLDWNQAADGKEMWEVGSQCETDRRRKAVWAGLGWRQNPKTGFGLFVEHHGYSKDKVVEDIHKSLEHMTKTREKKYGHQGFGDIHYGTIGIECRKDPVCALYIAVYKVKPVFEEKLKGGMNYDLLI